MSDENLNSRRKEHRGGPGFGFVKKMCIQTAHGRNSIP